MITTNSSKITLEHFIDEYIDTMLWADLPEECSETDSSISTQVHDKSTVDCLKFIKLLQRNSIIFEDTSRTAHDFWLTRNHHGTGFGAYPEVYGEENAEKITQLVQDNFQQQWLYVGDDNKLYLQ